MARPDIFPDWATLDLNDPITGMPNKLQPSLGFMNSGLNRGEPIIRQFLNYEFDKIVEWLRHYDDINNARSQENYIDNPIMGVQERPSGAVSSGNHFLTDRWYVGGSVITTTSLNEQAVPGLGFTSVARIEKESANTLEFIQRVPDYHKFAGKTFTVSYYYRMENFDPLLDGQIATGLFRTRISSKRTTAGGGNDFVGDDNPSGNPIITSDWTRHSYTFTVPDDASEVGFNNETYLWVGFATLGDFSTDTDLVIETTGWKLEEGDTATPFIKPNEQEDRIRCQLYYYKTYNRGVDPGTASAFEGAYRFDPDTDVLQPTIFPDMFTTPSVTIYSPSTGAAGMMYNAGPGGPFDSAASVIFAPKGGAITVVGPTSVGAGDRYTFHAVFDAEILT